MMGIEDLSVAYNTHRQYYNGRKFKAKEINETFGKMGFPRGNSFRVAANRNGLILKTGSGKFVEWMFPEQPVHKNIIKKALDEYKKDQAKYHVKSASKRQKFQIMSEEEKITSAIAFLKNLGYRIQKQVITYEEI